jgi:hypothetical protein
MPLSINVMIIITKETTNHLTNTMEGAENFYDKYTSPRKNNIKFNISCQSGEITPNYLHLF